MARERIAKRLVACGSNVNAEDSSGNTPLHLAVTSDKSEGNVEIARLLCVSGETSRPHTKVPRSIYFKNTRSEFPTYT